MSKYILLTVFFFSSFSIHAMEVSCPNQDKKQADNPPASTMQLQVSNHSEQIATFFSTVGASKLCAPRVLVPYEDSDPIAVMRKGKTYLNTFAGSFLLKQPKKDNPSKSLILHSLKALHKDDKWSTDKVVVQRMSYEQSHNVIAIVNPSGDIQLAQYHDAQELVIKGNLTSEEKISAQEMLHKAILRDSAEEIKVAIAAGADVNQERDGKSSLFWAVNMRKYQAIEALLDRNANKEKDLVENAVRDIKLMDLFVKKGIDISNCLNRCVELSIDQLRSDKSLPLIQHCIDLGYKVDDVWAVLTNKNSFFAPIYGSLENVTKLLIKNNANPNYKYTPAVGWGIVGQCTPLFSRVIIRDMASVKILLEAGAQINEPVHFGDKLLTPLSYALQRGYTGMAEFLMEHGAKL